ncbi:MAG: DUF11 domain-containing protein, partial [Anaerolineales bacterium]|nr:DUF11 domain-containing protein [Anaerolineales bacterium]
RGVTDTFTLSAEGYAWDVQMEPASLTLTPCAAASLVVSVTIPLASGWNVSDTITLTARSSISPSVAQTAVLTTKTPAPVLLVDDGDRWPHYDQQGVYRAAMAEAGLAYDLWNTESEGQLGGSPTLAALSPYPIVVWWTGYDWYQPVTAAERDVLDLYLQQGGRLLLSSQDLLDFHFDSPFVSDRLGVLTCTQSITLTQVRGVPGDPISQDLGPYVLAYPFPNWSDELQPSPGTAVVLRDQERRAVALSRRGGGPAAVFLSFPFEALPAADRPAVMQQAVGWLSWLGDSTWVADRNAAAPGDVLTFTLGVRNDGPDEVSASISNTLPSELTLIDGSVAGPAGVFSASHVLAWSGALQPGALVTISYRAAVSPEVGLGSAITNPIRLRLEDQSIEFGRSAVVRVGGADLSPSTYRLEPDLVHPVGLLTGTLALVNSGIGDASAVSSTIRLPTMATLVPGSVHADAGTVTVTNGAIHWRTALGAGQGVSLSYAMHAPAAFPSVTAYSVAVVRDLVSGDGVERPAWLRVTPRRVWLPVVAKQP